MLSEKTQKQLLLLTASLSGITGVVGALIELFGRVDALNKLPWWGVWGSYGFLILSALWLIVKWRTRHSRLLKPDALRLDRDNVEHLVGRADDINNLLQQCLGKHVVFLEGESGSGKSALIRSGLIPRLKEDRSILALMLGDLWVEHWERGPFQALRSAMISSGAFARKSGTQSLDASPPSATRALSTLMDVERELVQLCDEQQWFEAVAIPRPACSRIGLTMIILLEAFWPLTEEQTAGDIKLRTAPEPSLRPDR